MILLWPEKQLLKDKKINPNWFLFSWALPGYAVSIASGINFSRIFTISYLGFYLIIAYFFYILFRSQKKLFIILIAGWLTISLINLAVNLPANFSRWDLANNWLIANEKPGDKIIIMPFVHKLQFDRYYQGQVPAEEFYPLTDNKTLDERIVEKNWQLLINQNSIEKLGELTAGFSRILVIREIFWPDDYFNSIIHQWFEKNNWRVIEVYQPQAWFGPKIIVYSK
jgi:hypothetical protein